MSATRAWLATWGCVRLREAGSNRGICHEADPQMQVPLHAGAVGQTADVFEMRFIFFYQDLARKSHRETLTDWTTSLDLRPGYGVMPWGPVCPGQ